MSVLDKIIAYKKQEVEKLKRSKPLDETVLTFELSPHRSFAKAINQKGKLSIIAELKKASPSLGLIRPDFDPIKIAEIYEKNGADAISVLTDKHFFQGDIKFLPAVKSSVSLPILRKDFIIDPYQVYESKLYGADAILLITTALSRQELTKLLTLAYKLGLEALVEIHDEDDLEKALESGAHIIGINNRNLKTLKTDINTCLKLRNFIPDDKILVAESGIKTKDDMMRLKEAGFQAVLIGTALMQAKDIKQKLREFVI
ncbi:MAG: indole-3-glycerol phosphate synthase TrpC [Candidatus Desulfofervidaceae bacterium]|nr:indole-3-glycerol phosphate synthase TrpC [Candidatus Desulfofervidaceae bacterium]